MNHVTHLTYSAPSKDWSFSTKAKYAKLRTPRGLRTSFRKSFPFRPRMRPQTKVSPLERTRRARPSRWPVADVGARQPLQRAFTALAVRRKEHLPYPTEIFVKCTTIGVVVQFACRAIRHDDPPLSRFFRDSLSRFSVRPQ